jgi:GH35 family endo-1,4-beta-xylanase
MHLLQLPLWLKRNLYSLASTGLHIQITEFDIDGTSDAIQLQNYQRIFTAGYINSLLVVKAA